jgi:molybdate transport system permease protein
LFVAGNIPGSTQTLPIAIYDAIQTGDQRLANLLAVILTITAFGVLFLIQRLRIQILGGLQDG